jgi:hypothetical protein
MGRRARAGHKRAVRDDDDLRRALQLMAARAGRLSKPPRRAANPDRDLWVALDFHTRTGYRRAKLVAADWPGVGLKNPRHVLTIASRLGRRPEFQAALAALRALPRPMVRDLVRAHRLRLTRGAGWVRHVKALRLLQVYRAT